MTLLEQLLDVLTKQRLLKLVDMLDDIGIHGVIKDARIDEETYQGVEFPLDDKLIYKGAKFGEDVTGGMKFEVKKHYVNSNVLLTIEDNEVSIRFKRNDTYSSCHFLLDVNDVRKEKLKAELYEMVYLFCLTEVDA